MNFEPPTEWGPAHHRTESPELDGSDRPDDN